MRLMLISIIFCLTLSAAGQSDVNTALRNGDAQSLAAYFDDKVELCILYDENVVPRTVAVRKLADFFSENRVSSFEARHSGASKGKDSNYTIGQLNTSKGKYRVVLYFDSRAGKEVIQEFRIEEMD